MKKRFLSILSIILVLCFLTATIAGCGSPEVTYPEPDTESEAENESEKDSEKDSEKETEKESENSSNIETEESEDESEDESESESESKSESESTDDNTGDDNTGDDNTGDDNNGDDNTGDDNTGDDNTGDDNTGDDNTGDDNTGDDNTGDDNTGDDNTGDDNTGDDNTGDDNTGDDNTGDDNTGDDNTGDDNTGDDNTGDDNTGDDNTGDDNTGDDNTGDDNTGDDNTGDDNTGDDNTGDDNTGDDNTGDDNTGDDNTGDDNTGDDNTGDDNTGDDNTGDDNTGDDNTGDDNTGDDNTGDDNTGDDNTGDDNTGDDNTGDDNTGDDNTGDDNTGDDNTGDDNTGDDNTGDDNTGDDNTGDDNSDEFIDPPVVNNESPVRNGNEITFGIYPQSEVTNQKLIGTLSSKATTWTQSNNMWYADVENNGNKYRGVKTDENETAVWFKYEAVTWTILEEENGKAFILCNMVIDAQAYDSSNSNNYENSSIKAWLNNEFINTTFNELQKQFIITTEVNNGPTSTGYNNPRFSGNNTNDKIFLLSRAEAKVTEYNLTDSNRQKNATPYAIYQIGNIYNANNGAWWWLRTPAPHSTDATRADLAHTIKTDGTIYNATVASTQGGIVPAMWISLDADDDDQTPEGGENPEIPDPEIPDPETPDPEIPDPEIPDPETPDPETPDPEIPNPEIPDPENPENPETPDPETPEEPNEPEIIDVTFNTVFGSYNLNNKNDNSSFSDKYFASEIVTAVKNNLSGTTIDVLGIQRAKSKARFEALVAEVQALDSSYQYSYFFEGADGNIGFISRVPFENARVITGESGFKFGAADFIFETESGDKVAINFYVCSFDKNNLDAQIKDLDAELEGKSDYFIAGCFATSDYSVFENLPAYGNVNTENDDTIISNITPNYPDGMLYNTESWSCDALERIHTDIPDSTNQFNRYLCVTKATYNGTITRTAE